MVRCLEAVADGYRLPSSTPGRVELGIPGPIHLPHAAFADLGGDTAGAEGGAGGERHTVSRGSRHSADQAILVVLVDAK